MLLKADKLRVTVVCALHTKGKNRKSGRKIRWNISKKEVKNEKMCR
jgi:hypothetical protein